MEAAPDGVAGAIEAHERVHERAPLLDVDERRRQERIEDELANAVVAEQEALARLRVDVERRRAREPRVELLLRLLVTARERLAVPQRARARLGLRTELACREDERIEA